jgi:Ca2+-binding RTX toxin-like protein
VVIELKADADAYGVQGTGDDRHYVSIIGNPFAEVAAKSLLVGNDNDETLVGGLSANAIGLQHLAVSSVGDTNRIGASVEASIGAKDLGSNVSSDLYSITIGASAIGVDDVLVRSNANNQVNMKGAAALKVDLSGWDDFDAGAIDHLNSFGIHSSNITTTTGNDRIEGSATSAINQFELFLDTAELSVNGGGVVDTFISTGSGNDEVIGTASGDGLRAAQGFVNSYVNTGTGNDVVSGGASGSTFLMGIGDDAVTLLASEGSVLDGGIGNDNLKITGASSSTRLYGGIGNDQLQGGSGADNLSGGIGSDVIKGGAGADNFHFTGADMLSGTDKLVDFNGSEGDKIFLSSNLTGFEKGTAVKFVSAAQAQQAGFNMDQAVIVDSMANIQAMGSVSNSHLAYATDTGALLYDANGDWSQGSRTVAVLNDNGKNANLTAANIEIS